MGLPSILLVLGILVVAAGSIGSLSTSLFNKKTEAEKNKEEQDQSKRNDKGAFGNTVDFFFGEGTFKREQTPKGNSKNGGQGRKLNVGKITENFPIKKLTVAEAIARQEQIRGRTLTIAERATITSVLKSGGSQ